MTLTVDLHNHVIPDFYWEASNEGGKAAGGITPPPWSLDGMVAYMDEARIDLAVPSISTQVDDSNHTPSTSLTVSSRRAIQRPPDRIAAGSIGR